MSAATRGDGSTAQRGLTGDFTTGITIAYPDSPLTIRLPGNESSRIEPGDRMPDAECADASTGERVRVFDLLQGPHWTLLRFGGFERAGDLPDHTHALVDTHDGHGVPTGTSVLVRPDGYAAALGTGDVLGPLGWARPDGQ